MHNSYPSWNQVTVSFGQPEHATSSKAHFLLLLLLQGVPVRPPAGAGPGGAALEVAGPALPGFHRSTQPTTILLILWDTCEATSPN